MKESNTQTFQRRFSPLVLRGLLLVCTVILIFSFNVEHAEATSNRCGTVTYTTGGTIDTAEDAPSANFFHGAWFQGQCDAAGGTGDATISRIAITINDATGISNMDIYTDQAASCATADPTAATLFGSTASVSTLTEVTGTATISYSQFRCWYVIVDIGTGAADQQTLNIYINANTDIDTSTTEAGTFPLNPAGVTTISNAGATVPATVTSRFTGGVGPTYATLFGSVISDGGASITQHGFVTASNISFTSSPSTTTLGALSPIGEFFGPATFAAADTLYYYRAYATNSAGPGYGSARSVTTGNSTVIRKIRLFSSSTIRLYNGRMIIHKK